MSRVVIHGEAADEELQNTSSHSHGVGEGTGMFIMASLEYLGKINK